MCRHLFPSSLSLGVYPGRHAAGHNENVIVSVCWKPADFYDRCPNFFCLILIHHVTALGKGHSPILEWPYGQWTISGSPCQGYEVERATFLPSLATQSWDNGHVVCNHGQSGEINEIILVSIATTNCLDHVDIDLYFITCNLCPCFITTDPGGEAASEKFEHRFLATETWWLPLTYPRQGFTLGP